MNHQLESLLPKATQNDPTADQHENSTNMSRAPILFFHPPHMLEFESGRRPGRVCLKIETLGLAALGQEVGKSVRKLESLAGWHGPTELSEVRKALSELSLCQVPEVKQPEDEEVAEAIGRRFRPIFGRRSRPCQGLGNSNNMF